MKLLRWIALLGAALGWSAAASAQPGAPTGAVAPQECTVAEVIADLCGPKLTGLRIYVNDGADSTECGNLGDLGLGSSENLCRWSAAATAWVTDDVAGFGGGGTHPVNLASDVTGTLDGDAVDLTSTSERGTIEIATIGEVGAGSVTNKAVTPFNAGKIETGGDISGALEAVIVGDDSHDHTDGTHPVLADHIDALTEIAAALKTGLAASKLVTGSAGFLNECAKWDTNGDLVGATLPCGPGGADSVKIDGVDAADPDFTSDGDLEVIRCTAPSTPDPDCAAAEDVIWRYGALSIVNADVSDQLADRIFGDKITPATILLPGTAEIANQGEVDTGTDNARFVTPATLAGAAMTGDLGGTFGSATVADASHSHTVANLSDTSASAGELDTVTDGSNADTEHVHTDTGHPVLANHIDALTEIAAAIKSGTAGPDLITGAATNGECGQFDSNGDLVGAGAACGTGGGDSVEIDGVAATDPDFRSDGDLDAIRCTGPGAPDASCAAAEDVIYRYNAGSIADADVDASAAIAGSKLATDVLVEADVGDGLEVTSNTLHTKSDEAGFLEDLGAGDLTCGGGNAGKIAVNDNDALQYCDGSATPTRFTFAYGDDTGKVTNFQNANDLNAAGDVADASHSHTVANLSDTTAAAGELDDVTDGSNADTLHVHTDTGHPVLADHIDTLTEIATALKSGDDAKLVTGTATTGECVEYDANGDAIGYGAPCDFPDDFRIGGEFNLLDTSGTTPTLASGATPSVAGSSVWKTEGTTKLTNFTGSPDVGDLVLIWVKNTMSFDCSRSGGALFFCDGGFLEDMPSRNGEMVLWFWDGTYWRLVSVSNAARLDVASITIREPTTDDDIYFFRVPGNKSADVVYFNCICSGAESSPSLNVRLLECNTVGQSCAVTGGDHTISQRYVNYLDNAPGTITNYQITGSKFWQLDLNTVTTTPTLLDCDIAYFLY